MCFLICSSKYNKFGRTYLFDIDFYYLRLMEDGTRNDEWQTKYLIDAYHAGNVSSVSSKL